MKKKKEELKCVCGKTTGTKSRRCKPCDKKYMARYRRSKNGLLKYGTEFRGEY